MSRCPSGRNNPNAVITLGVGDEQKNSLGEPELYESLLAIVLTIVEYRNCEGVRKGELRAVEGDAVLARIGASLGIIPFEV